jgi:serine/threonine protein kinase
MQVASKDWLGKSLDNYVLDSLIAEGPYSWVFQATQNNTVRAIKVAKPTRIIEQTRTEELTGTRVLAFITGGVTDIVPDSMQLLALQAEKLKGLNDPGLVHVEEAVFKEDLCYCRMEFVAGKTLRVMINDDCCSMAAFIELAHIMERLSQNRWFGHHGDLKPENIMISTDGIKLIDPGYFGTLDATGGTVDKCIVTTPAYYPLLAPDDLLSFGIILWEAVLKKHPLGGATSLEAIDQTNLGEDLINWARYKELVGQYYLTPILEAGRPSAINPAISPELEMVLMKGIRLHVRNDNKIDKIDGYKSFAEFAADLERFKNLDIGNS